jgi:hypothetical protein
MLMMWLKVIPMYGNTAFLVARQPFLVDTAHDRSVSGYICFHQWWLSETPTLAKNSCSHIEL